MNAEGTSSPVGSPSHSRIRYWLAFEQTDGLTNNLHFTICPRLHCPSDDAPIVNYSAASTFLCNY